MKKKLAAKSSLIGLLSKIITMLFSFISTRIFMHVFGVEIRGINSILVNCLGFLQLAELGIGNAIIYGLYKPLVENDITEIQLLMKLYKKLYRYIGIIIIIVGMIMSLFLKIFVSDTTYSMGYVRSLFYIQLITTASTYFCAYKRNLLYADQKMYINTIIDTVCAVISTILKIASMIYFKSFVLYLVIHFFQTLISNLLIQFWCNRHYPYIKEKVEGKYKKIPQLVYNVKNIVASKISGYVYSSTDNLIISAFQGVIQVGYMSSYYEIVNILKMISISITEPIQPIIGNFINVNKSKERSYELFRSYTLIRYIIANITVVGLIVMIDPLITLWLGKEYILPIIIPILLASDLFISIVHGPLGEFINVLGLFRDDRNLSIIGALINLVTSIIFVFQFGTQGVLLGTVLAQLFYWVARTRIIFGQYFKQGLILYIKRIFEYMLVLIIDVFIALLVRNNIMQNITILSFILMSGMCVLISIVSIILCFGRTKEFDEVLNMLKTMVNR